MERKGFYINDSMNMIFYGSDKGHTVDVSVILTDFRFGFDLNYHYPRWDDLIYVCSESDLDGLDNFLSFIKKSNTDTIINYYSMKKLIKKALKNSKQIDDYSNCLIMDSQFEKTFN